MRNILTEPWCEEFDLAPGDILQGTASVKELTDPVNPLDFELYGTPDRIDALPDGWLHILDYKTGTPPTKKQQEQFDKQLLLAAAMAERGGFRQLGPMKIHSEEQFH